MTPKGSDLAATDLVEVSTLVSGSYVTRSITGQELIDAVPSAPQEVQSYANLAAFPVTGVVDTIYIAEDTNKTYRWTGSVYVEISATASTAWGGITGTLSAQTDLQNALNAKENTISAGTTSQYFRGDKTFQTLDKTAVGLGNVDNTSDLNKPISTATQTALNAKQDSLGFTAVPTTRTLTINGTALDLSADRSWTIATGLTIGSTAISSGTIGRVLFQGAGNVLQQSSSLFWDNTNSYLGIGTSSPTTILHINGNSAGTNPSFQIRQQTNTTPTWFSVRNTDSLGTSGAISLDLGISGGSNQFFTGTSQGDIILKAYSNLNTSKFFLGATSGSTAQLVLFPSTGNVAIGTTTDSGYKLDVNGTARVVGNSFLSNTFITASGAQLGVGTSTINAYYKAGISGNIGTTGLIVLSSDISGSGTPVYLERTASLFNVFSTLPITFSVGSEAMRIFGTTRNIGINTTTDAGYKLDVNGTARVQDAGSELTITSPLTSIAPVIFSTKGALGGYRGGYNFKGGYGGSVGNTIFIIDTGNTDATSRAGIGNFSFGDLTSGKLSIDNTQSGGRNAAIRLRANYVNTSTEYNGIDFNAYTGTDIGGFIGSQRNTATSGFGADIVVFATRDTGPSTYLEIARFMGRYNSFYVGTDKTLAVPSAKMQVESTTQGFLPPRMTNAQRTAIATPAVGLVVYCTDAVEGLYIYKSTGWTFVI